MVRFSLAPAFIVRHASAPQFHAYNVQRACGHYERVILSTEPGVFDRLCTERHLYCGDCAGAPYDPARLAIRPRLRIVCDYGVWGVERLMATAQGIGFHVVAFLSSHEECVQWIAATFAGRPYEVIADPAFPKAYPSV